MSGGWVIWKLVWDAAIPHCSGQKAVTGMICPKLLLRCEYHRISQWAKFPTEEWYWEVDSHPRPALLRKTARLLPATVGGWPLFSDQLWGGIQMLQQQWTQRISYLMEGACQVYCPNLWDARTGHPCMAFLHTASTLGSLWSLLYLRFHFKQKDTSDPITLASCC